MHIYPRNGTKLLFWMVLPLLLVTNWGHAAALAQEKIVIDGLEREFHYYIPQSQAGPMPLVFVLHGATVDGVITDMQTRFSDLAKSEGFVVVFPDGVGNPSGWNVGGCCKQAGEMDVDDTGFVEALIGHMKGKASIDNQQIFAAGMSNGAMLAHKLACEMPTRFRAIATVAGRMLQKDCAPGSPVSLVTFDMLDDDVLPYGGAGPFNWLPPVETTLASWLDINQCEQAPLKRQFDGYDRVDYGCGQGRTIRSFTLYQGGHIWPGDRFADQGMVVDATAEIWEFFSSGGGGIAEPYPPVRIEVTVGSTGQ